MSDAERAGGAVVTAPSTPPPEREGAPAVSLSAAVQLVQNLRLDVARLKLLLRDV